MSLKRIFIMAFLLAINAFANKEDDLPLYYQGLNYDHLDRSNYLQDVGGYPFDDGQGFGEGYGFEGLYGYGYAYGASRPLQGLVDGYNGYGTRSYAYGGYQPFSGMSVRYGDGGFGDKNYANFNLRSCAGGAKENCTANEPDAGEYEWRFIRNIGWRQMATYDAARKDWWDYKRSVPLPFNYFNFPRF